MSAERRRRSKRRLAEGGCRPVLAAPAGVEETEIVARFDGWDLVSTQPDTEGEIAGPLRNVPRAWYRLIRR